MFSIIIIILGELLEAMKGTDALTNDGKFFLFFLTSRITSKARSKEQESPGKVFSWSVKD